MNGPVHIAPVPPHLLSGQQKAAPQYSCHALGVEQPAPSGRQHWFWSRLPIGPHATSPSQLGVQSPALVQFAAGWPESRPIRVRSVAGWR